MHELKRNFIEASILSCNIRSTNLFPKINFIIIYLQASSPRLGVPTAVTINTIAKVIYTWVNISATSATARCSHN